MQTVINSKKQFATIANECLHSLKPNVQYNFTFEEVKQTKTLKQLNFLFGAIISSLQEYYEETEGEEFSKELLKTLLYEEIGIDSIIFLPKGKRCVYKKTLSKMTKEEASEFINNCIIWLDENTECRLSPSIRYLWTANVAENEIERCMQSPYPEKDSLYLVQLRKGYCLNCGAKATEVHHLRQGAYSIGKKNPDYLTFGICAECHRKLHDSGERNFLENIKHNVINNLDIEVFCRLLYHRIRNGM